MWKSTNSFMMIPNVTFQLILHESGDVTIQYKNIPERSVLEDMYGEINPVLIGYEDPEGTAGTQYNTEAVSDLKAISTALSIQEGDLRRWLYK